MGHHSTEEKRTTAKEEKQSAIIHSSMKMGVLFVPLVGFCFILGFFRFGVGYGLDILAQSTSNFHTGGYVFKTSKTK
jgi:hypothetical protein